MPVNWRVMMFVICLFLVASIGIGAYQMMTTPNEVFGNLVEGLPKSEYPR